MEHYIKKISSVRCSGSGTWEKGTIESGAGADWWDSALALNQKILGLNPTDVPGQALGPNLMMRPLLTSTVTNAG